MTKYAIACCTFLLNIDLYSITRMSRCTLIRPTDMNSFVVVCNMTDLYFLIVILFCILTKQNLRIVRKACLKNSLHIVARGSVVECSTRSVDGQVIDSRPRHTKGKKIVPADPLLDAQHYEDTFLSSENLNARHYQLVSQSQDRS